MRNLILIVLSLMGQLLFGQMNHIKDFPRPGMNTIIQKNDELNEFINNLTPLLTPQLSNAFFQKHTLSESMTIDFKINNIPEDVKFNNSTSGKISRKRLGKDLWRYDFTVYINNKLAKRIKVEGSVKRLVSASGMEIIFELSRCSSVEFINSKKHNILLNSNQFINKPLFKIIIDRNLVSPEILIEEIFLRYGVIYLGWNSLSSQ